MSEVTIQDLLDTALDKGVVVQGDATISVADVDLVFLGLKLVLTSVETMESWKRSARRPTSRSIEAGGDGQTHEHQKEFAQAPALPPKLSAPKRESETHSPAQGKDGSIETPAKPVESQERPIPDPDKVEQGLAKLVLTVVDLVRRLLQKQAIRRMDGGSLTEEEIDRMGQALQRLEQKMEELKRVFGLEQEELNLNLGPLGNLM